MRIVILLLLLISYSQCRSISEAEAGKTDSTNVEKIDPAHKTAGKIIPKVSENEKAPAGGGSMWSAIKNGVSGAVSSAMDGAAGLTGYVSKLFRRWSSEENGNTTTTTATTIPVPVQKREAGESDEQSFNPDLGEEIVVPLDEVVFKPEGQPPNPDLGEEVVIPVDDSNDEKPPQEDPSKTDPEQEERKNTVEEKEEAVVEEEQHAEEEPRVRETTTADEDVDNEGRGKEPEEDSRRIRRTSQEETLETGYGIPGIVLKGDAFDVPDLT